MTDLVLSTLYTGSLIRLAAVGADYKDAMARWSNDAEFQRLREALQKTMLKVVAESKARFNQPWGMAALYWAAGTPGTAKGKLTAGPWSLVRP